METYFVICVEKCTGKEEMKFHNWLKWYRKLEEMEDNIKRTKSKRDKTG